MILLCKMTWRYYMNSIFILISLIFWKDDSSVHIYNWQLAKSSRAFQQVTKILIFSSLVWSRIYFLVGRYALSCQLLEACAVLCGEESLYLSLSTLINNKQISRLSKFLVQGGEVYFISTGILVRVHPYGWTAAKFFMVVSDRSISVLAVRSGCQICIFIADL